MRFVYCEQKRMKTGDPFAEKKTLSAEEALQESELRFRSVVETANDAVILVDSSGRILSVNKAAGRIFGFGDDLLGESIVRLFPERLRSLQEELLRPPAGTIESREMQGLRRDGSEFPMELSLTSWQIGEQGFCCITIRDITRRKQVEGALIKKTAEVQLLQDVAVASNEATDVQQAFQFAVDRICSFLGWPIGHVYFPEDGTSDRLVPSGIWHMDAQDLYWAFRKITEKANLRRGAGLCGRVLEEGKGIWITDDAAGGKLPKAIHRLGIRSGFAFPVLVDSDIVAVLEFFASTEVEPDEHLMETMHHIGGMLGRVVERQRAVAALRHAESSARQLVESIQAIIWRAEATTLRFTFVSNEAEMILGYPAAEWLAQEDFWACHIHPEDREWAVSYCVGSMIQRKDFSFDFRMIARDGRVVWFRNVVRVLVESDQPCELVGVMIDITQQKESEMEVKNSREQLRALSGHLQFVREEERTRIAREIHDELGQVLTALRMDLSLLNRGLLESSANMPRFKLMEEIGAMRRLVDQTIQAVRRIATELRPEVLNHLDLKAAIEWYIQEYQARSGIACEFLSNIDAVDLDRDSATALFRIFQEAMTNVARHSNAMRVNIGLQRDDGMLTMEVSDNGRGISEAEMSGAHSFGLMGIRERALLLGGVVEIKGIPGKGTSLTVRVSCPKKSKEA